MVIGYVACHLHVLKISVVYVNNLCFLTIISNTDPKRKPLATGAVPTENPPLRSHKSTPKPRRPLVQRITSEACSSTASASEASPPVAISSIADESLEVFASKVRGIIPEPWIITTCTNTEVRIELWDSSYSIPRFIIHFDTGLRFSLHIYNWLLPDTHHLYITRRRRMDSGTVAEFLEDIIDGNYVICEGLRQDEYVQSVAKDPGDSGHGWSFSDSDVIRHSIPNRIDMDSNFRALVAFRCVDCQLLIATADDEEQVICDPCKKLQRNIVVQQNRKKRSTSAPAKDKAPFAACSAEKLRATVVEKRLEYKQLKNKVKYLQGKIEKSGVSVSEPLEKDLLTIMSRQNLDSTPHMKFFWEQQIHLVKTKKMGRRYHSQMIRFALPIHCKSPSVY